MGFSLKKLVKGVVAEVNPFDHGQTFQSVMHNQPAPPPPASTGRPNIAQQIVRNNPVASGVSNVLHLGAQGANYLGHAIDHNPVGHFVNDTVLKPVYTTDTHASQLLKGNNPYHGNAKQVAGQIGQDLLNVGSVVPAGKVVEGAAKAAPLTTKLVQGAKMGAKGGGVFGAAQGVSTGLQNNNSFESIVKQGAIGGGLGTVAGAALGAGAPIVGEGLKTGVKEARPLLQSQVGALNVPRAVAKQADEAIKAITPHNDAFGQKLQQIGQNLGEAVKQGPIKTPGRVAEKATSDYGGDISKVRDMVRGTLHLSDPNSLDQHIAEIGKHYPITRIKNGLNNVGYKDVKVNVKLPSGHEGEVILATPEHLQAKHELGGHALYKQMRTEVDSNKLANLEAQSHQLYSQADQRLADRLASSGDTSVPSTTALAGGNGSPVDTTTPLVDLPSSSRRTNVPSTSKNLTDGITPPFTSNIPQNAANFKDNPLPMAPMSAREAATNVARGVGKVPTKFNTDKLNIDQPGKDLVAQSVKDLQPELEKTLGRKLTNEEVKNIADISGQGLNSKTSVETTATLLAQGLNARRAIAEIAKDGKLSPESADTFVRELQNIKTLQTHAGRLLQGQGIEADPRIASPMERIIGEVLKKGKDLKIDEVIKAAEGVDFTNAKQASEFYRKFIKPSKQDWIDLVRYNSMLSSPLTHIVNTSSNLINSAVVAPIEKTLTGTLDFFRSAVTGKERQAFAGEAGAYAKGYVQNVNKATRKFVDVMRGNAESTNLDTRNIPLSTGGASGKLYNNLSYPMRLLEGMDQLFTTMAAGGEKAALELRQRKGVDVGNVDLVAHDKAAYRLFRQGLNAEGQGNLLNNIDRITGWLQNARNSEGAAGTIAKYTLPFVQTPMNIFKQGVEYSPLGFGTIKGSANKTEQLSKAIIGSSVFAGAAMALESGKLTWSEPTSAKQKAEFRAAGMQPYSIKFGNHWVSFQKMPPGIAFPFAMIAAIDDAKKNAKIDDNAADKILTAISSYGSFLSDQSYAKSIGDTLAALKGDQEKGGLPGLIGNYAGQTIPWKGALGWVARAGDPLDRRVDGSFAEKQVQLLMQSIPGLREKTPARLDNYDEPIAAQNPKLNAISPFRVTTENQGHAANYADMRQMSIDAANKKAANAQAVKNGTRTKGGTNLSPGISNDAKTTLTSYDAMDSKAKAEFKKNPKNAYKLELAQYENDSKAGKLNDVQKQTKEKALAKMAITSDYDKEVVDFYNLSNTDKNAYFKRDPKKAQELYDKAKELSGRLASAGMTAKKVSTSSKKGGSTRKSTGRKTARKSSMDFAKRMATTNTTTSKSFGALRGIVKRKPSYKRKAIKMV